MNYKLFGKSCLRVSELCLGTMSFGTEWKWGCDKDVRLGERATNITRKVVEVTDRLGVSASQLAINWRRQHKNQSVIPIVGATKVSQVEEVLGCLNFEIPVDLMNELNEISKVELPFPQKFMNEPGVLDVLYGGVKGSMKDSRY